MFAERSNLRLLLVCPNSSPMPWRGFKSVLQQKMPNSEFHILLINERLRPLAGDDFSGIHLIASDDDSDPTLEAVKLCHSHVHSINQLIIKDRWLVEMDRNKAKNIVINLYSRIYYFIKNERFDGVIGEISSIINELCFIACQNLGVTFFWPMASFFSNRFFFFKAEDSYGFQKMVKNHLLELKRADCNKVSFDENQYFNRYLTLVAPQHSIDVNIQTKCRLAASVFIDSVRGFLSNLKTRLFFSSAYYNDNLVAVFLGIFVKTKRTFFGSPLVKDFTMAPGTRYFLYYLHYDPDLSTLQWAANYHDQVIQIRKISDNLPSGTVLLVKEHPLSKLIRPRQFYREISEIDDVVLLNPDVPSPLLLPECVAVITITGTIGFEAWVYGKPVIVLGHTFFDDFIGVFRCRDYDLLRDKMFSLVVREFIPIPEDERKKLFLAVYRSTISGRYNEFEKFEKKPLPEIKKDLRSTYLKMIDYIVSYLNEKNG